MELSTLFDFYVLLALDYQVQDRGTKSRAQEKLARDLAQTLESLSQNLAAALFDYLYLILVGEARWAPSKVRYTVGLGDPEGSWVRDQAYALARRYSPEEGLPVLVKLFELDWDENFGGRPWLEVARLARRYRLEGLPARIFVDHAAALEHHGGPVFDKFEAQRWVGLELNVSDQRLQALLDHVARAKILELPADLELQGWYHRKSRTTARLWHRYHQVFLDQPPPDWIQLTRPCSWEYLPISYGDWKLLGPMPCAGGPEALKGVEPQERVRAQVLVFKGGLGGLPACPRGATCSG